MKSMNEEAYSDTKSLASELGIKTAYDDLSSDVTHFYKTGVKCLDIVLGGGVPSGKVVELFGWESCFTGDTEITLLNGDSVAIKDLVGKDEFWVYSCTPDGHIVPGHGHDARITKYVDELYEITTNTDDKIRCTTDHRFMMEDGTYKRAYDLKVDDKLMRFIFADWRENKHNYTSDPRFDVYFGTFSFLQNDGDPYEYIPTENNTFEKIEIESDDPEYPSKCLHNRFKTWVKDIQLIKVDHEPVYDITVDEYNNFALSAGCFVHNSGKSALSLVFSKTFTEYWKEKNQKCVVLWIEAESAFDKMRARYFGCDLDRYLIMEAIDVEDAFQKMETTIMSASNKGIKLFIVLDTIAALQTTKERESGQFSGGIAEKPRVIKNCLRKLVPLLGQTDTTLILVNQVYTTLGSYVPSSESPGGGGIKFFSSIRANITVKKKDVTVLPSGEEVTKAIISEVFTKKNKITLPQQKCLIYLYGDKGIDPYLTAYEYMVKNKLFKGAAWKTYTSRKMTDGQVVNFEIKFQNENQLKDKAEAESINILDYFDYEVTKNFADTSPFIKVKLIQDLWDFEEAHFGQKESTLTEEEKDLAKLIFDRISKTDVSEDEEAFERIEKELSNIS